MTEILGENDADIFLSVSNIPGDFHTYDLRRHFSCFVETDKFSCFHFRHRPEEGKFTDSTQVDAPRSSYAQSTCSRVHTTSKSSSGTKATSCCLVRMKSSYYSSFHSKYHRKHWQDFEENERSSKCLITCVKFTKLATSLHSSKDESSVFLPPEMKNLPELQPPNLMPRGNVGTSTNYFLRAIKECRMSSKLIGKLRLEFPKSRHRKYGAVSFDYGDRFQNDEVGGRLYLSDRHKTGPRIETVEETDEDNPEGEDNDTCEEWERHEALHNDVQARRNHGHQVNSLGGAELGDLEQQAGTKERLFEEEIELVWEKGGSGLNFYTDAQYWREKEGDFDEQTTDDWDVDMSVYYEKDTRHDKDAEDALDMRREQFLRNGQHTQSVFKPKKGKMASQRGTGKRKPFAGSGLKVGSFEAHTTGYGSRIMVGQGWRGPGHGLGKGQRGHSMPVLVDEDEAGQGPSDKSGFGYYGEKLVIPWKKPPPPGARITGMHTVKEDQDPAERYDRSNPPLYLKFRDQPVRFCRGGVQTNY